MRRKQVINRCLLIGAAGWVGWGDVGSRRTTLYDTTFFQTIGDHAGQLITSLVIFDFNIFMLSHGTFFASVMFNPSVLFGSGLPNSFPCLKKTHPTQPHPQVNPKSEYHHHFARPRSRSHGFRSSFTATCSPTAYPVTFQFSPAPQRLSP